MRQNYCVVCQGMVLTLTIAYVDENKQPTMWKEVEPWYGCADNEHPTKLHCKQCGLLYDHEAI